MRTTWFNDKSIPIVEIENRYICLAGWNGERYTACWETSDGFDVQSEDIEVKPIYSNDEEMNIVDYEYI
jgi:hypothetical protein